MATRFSRFAWSDGHVQIVFQCPGCHELHGPLVEHPEGSTRARWTWNGDLTLATFTPSLLIRVESSDSDRPTRVCHSFIREGRIQFLNDCTHALAGQTVDVPEWEA